MTEIDNKGFFRNIDSLIVWLVIFLVLAGLVSVFAAVYNEESGKILDFSNSFGKQVMWVGISLILFVFILFIDGRIIMNLSYVIYGITIILLIATLFIGREVNASRSWIQIGGFNLQASEFAKFSTALAIARYLDKFEFDLSNFKHSIPVFLFLLLPMGLILLQNDFGSAFVFISFIFVFFRQGLSPLFLIIPFILAILFFLALLVKFVWIVLIVLLISFFIYMAAVRKRQVLWFIILAATVAIGFSLSVDYMFNNVLQPHQKSRINVILGKEIDLKGAGYQTHQSLISIGSGGVAGKGFLKGTQTKFDFIPKQSTDFIFCTIAEEYGLWGSILVLVLFSGLLIRIIILSERQKFRFSRNYGYGIAGVIFFHYAANIAMVLGLFPVIGIPLPFVSYGGSSLIGFSLMIAVFLKLDADYKHYFN